MPNSIVVVHAGVQVKPERVEEFRRATRENAEHSVREPGVVRFDVVQDAEDPAQACVRGMRIPLSLVVNLVANGMTQAEILVEYPDLEAEDVHQALRYAVWLTTERILPAQVVAR